MKATEGVESNASPKANAAARNVLIIAQSPVVDLSLRPPLLYTVVQEVRDENGPVVRHRHGDGVAELARATAPASEAREKSAVGGELLDPVIVEVSDKDGPTEPVTVVNQPLNGP